MIKYDAILIPGGGLLADGSLPPWTNARLELALKHFPETKWIGLLSGGTVHKPPPLDQSGFPLYESKVLAGELITRGVSADRILTEICSYDTIGNAYFSRLLFADPLRLARVLVITSQFHMPRTRDIFQWIYNLPPQSVNFDLDFVSSANIGLSGSLLAARLSREKQSLHVLQSTKRKIVNLDQFHRWLYSEHKAYTPSRTADRLSPEELKSY